jgi:hypothetical protein
MDEKHNRYMHPAYIQEIDGFKSLLVYHLLSLSVTVTQLTLTQLFRVRISEGLPTYENNKHRLFLLVNLTKEKNEQNTQKTSRSFRTR